MMTKTLPRAQARCPVGADEKALPVDGGQRPLDILVIASQLPYPPNSGGPIRLYNLYSRLGKKHRLTWVCPIWPGNEVYIQEAALFCERVVELPRDGQPPLPERGWRNWFMRAVAHLHWERLFVLCFGHVRAPGLYWLPATPERVSRIEENVHSPAFDLVVCENQTTAELFPKEVDAPRALAIFDMQSTLFRRARSACDISWEDRLFFWPELFKIIRYEKRNYARFNLGIAVSETDGQRLRRRCPNLPVEIIPNGVDLACFQPVAGPVVPNSLVYVGHYGYPPNADAMLYFCREILPLIRERIADVEVWAVGHQPPEDLAAHEGVKAVGSVPDVRPYLAEASVVIVPLRAGGGTRIKIIEALAMGKAVVSTKLGAEGLQVTHGRDILLADEPGEFAECVARLLEQPELRARLGKNGRRLAEQLYDWDILAVRLDRLFQEVVRDYRTGKAMQQPMQTVLSKEKHAPG